MRSTAVLAFTLALVAGAVAACGDDDTPTPVLLVGTASGIAVLDGATGELGAPVVTASSTPDGEVLVHTEATGSRTSLRAVDIAAGVDRWAAEVEGTFEPRVVAPGAARVALTPPAGPPAPGALAPGRLRTDLAVVHDDGQVDRYDVGANIEPEAFSLDGTALFVVQFLPSEQPTEYQVRVLDLETGELGDVYSADAEFQHAMGGTARTSLWDPDGTRLYTFYTQEVGTETVAFVHVLDLDEQWAHCVALPEGFTPSSGGLALDEDARHLYVADARSGIVADVDTESLAVDAHAELPATPSSLGSPVAVVGDELFVAAGPTVRRLDRRTLEEVGAMPVRADVLGLQPSTSDDEVFVATAAVVELRAVDSGEVRRQTWATPAAGSFTGLGARTTVAYAGIQCAC